MITMLYQAPDAELSAVALDMPEEQVLRMAEQITRALRVRVELLFPNGAAAATVPDSTR